MNLLSSVGKNKALWMNSLLLAPGETVVSSWAGRRREQSTGVDGEPRVVWNGGILVMTNDRMLWIEERGIFEKSYHLRVAVGLEQIMGVSMGGWLSKYVTITSIQGSQDFRLNGVGENEFSDFKQIIVKQSDLSKSSILISSPDQTRLGQCSKCSFPLNVSAKLFEAALNDPLQWPLTIQGVCPKCGTNNVMYEDVPATCDHCGNRQTKKGQTRCAECGAPYPQSLKN